MTEIEDAPTIVFPYMCGPAIRRFGTALLWNNTLLVSGGSFVSPYAVRHFDAVLPAVTGTGLEATFRHAAHHAVLAARQVMMEVDHFAELRPHVNVIAMVGPGNLKSYDDWTPFHSTCLPIAAAALADTQVLNAASNAFVWRVYDTGLDLGSRPGEPLKDPKPLMKYFEDRAQTLGGAEHLLAETLLHQHGAFRKIGGLVTDSLPTLKIFEEIGKTITNAEQPSGPYQREMAFAIFDALFREHVSVVERKDVCNLAKLLEQRRDELARAKNACIEAAASLLLERCDEMKLKAALAAILERFEEEIGSLIQVNRSATRGVLRRLTEDEKVWISIGSIAAALAGALPSFVPVAAAITAFSLLGTHALKESRERSNAIKSSPWAFVYYLHR